MSQSKIGSFPDLTSPQKPSQPQQLPPSQFSEMLRQELNTCEENCDQSYLFLTETRERLRLAQQLMQLQETSAKSLQDRISDLEQELLIKSEQLHQAHLDRDDLRDRLKREKHNSYQLKTALERCLEPSQAQKPDTWSIPAVASAPHQVPAQNQGQKEQPSPAIAAANQEACKIVNANPSNIRAKSPHESPPQDLTKPELVVFAAEVSAMPAINVYEERAKLVNSAVKLPQFPPMQRR